MSPLRVNGASSFPSQLPPPQATQLRTLLAPPTEPRSLMALLNKTRLRSTLLRKRGLLPRRRLRLSKAT